MGAPIFVVRVRILSTRGEWDSLNTDNPRAQPRIVFSTDETLEPEPNTATIGVYNLDPDIVALINGVVTIRLDWSPEERAELLAKGASAAPFEQTSDEAGYGVVELSHGWADSETIDDPGELEAALTVAFVGQINDGPKPVREGQDVILRLGATDAGETLGAATVVQEAGGGDVAFEAKSYDAGVRISVILADMINAIGIGVDVDALDAQLVAAFARKGYPGAELELGSGYNASGRARPQIEAFLRNLGLLWSIQRGEFIVLDDTGVLPGFADLELGPEQIIGTPKPTAPNKLEVSTLANATARPGRRTTALSSTIRASYRPSEVSGRGDSYSGGQTTMNMDELQTIPGAF